MSKSKSNAVPASASEVRTWGRENVDSLPEGTNLDSLFGKNHSGVVRGRVNPVISAAFTAATGRPYAEKSVAEQKSIPLTLTKRDKNGRSRGKVVVTFPVAEVRALGGAPAKGRLSSAVLAAATARAEADRGW